MELDGIIKEIAWAAFYIYIFGLVTFTGLWLENPDDPPFSIDYLVIGVVGLLIFWIFCINIKEKKRSG